MSGLVDRAMDAVVYPLLRQRVVTGENLDRFLRTGSPCVRAPCGARTPRAVVFVHGNRTRTSELRPWLQTLAARAQCDVFAVPYAGYDSGVPSHDAHGRALDAMNVSTVAAAVRELSQSSGGAYQTVGVVAHSLGCALALQASAVVAPAALVLVAPFMSLRAVAHDQYGWLAGVVCPDRLNNEVQAQQVTVPTLLLHGMHDEVVPPRHSSQLFTQLTRSPRRERVLVPTEGHALTQTWARTVGDAVRDFMPQR